MPTHPDFSDEPNFTAEELADIFQLTEEDRRIMNTLQPGFWAPITTMTGTQLMAATFPEVEWVIPGIIPEGFTVIAAPPKAGKSWLVLDTAIALSTASKTLGAYETPEARPVLYLALEDTFKRLQKRLTILDYQPSDLLTIRINLEEELYETVITDWLAQHSEQKPLVIVDTLGRVRPVGDANYNSDYAFSASFKKLVDPIPGAALWAVHHTRQRQLGVPLGDFLESVSGTSGITGAADTIAVLARERHETSAIFAVTGRDVEENQYALEFVNGRWVIDPRNPHPKTEADSDDPVGYVLSEGEATFEQIRTHAHKLTSEAVQKRLKRAEETGLLARFGHKWVSAE